MKVLVTGGAGFVGSNFVRHLLANSDDRVRVLDSLTYAASEATLGSLIEDGSVEFIRGDICDPEVVGTALREIDFVVHFAAESHVDRSLMHPEVFIRTNCEGTNVICDRARAAGVSRVVHVSTDEVYGSIDDGAFRETDRLSPSSPYSASKAASDLIALSHHKSHDLEVVVTRSANQFGPYQFPEKLIPFFVSRLLDGLTVPLYGDGLNVRDWLFVEDNCRAIDVVMRTGLSGEIYNIGAGHEKTNRQVVDELLALLGLDEDRVEYVADRPGHDRRYSLDSGKVAALGVSQGREFSSALAETVEWYSARRDWWEPLITRVKNR